MLARLSSGSQYFHAESDARPLTLIPIRIRGTGARVLAIRETCGDTRNSREPLKLDIFKGVDRGQNDE